MFVVTSRSTLMAGERAVHHSFPSLLLAFWGGDNWFLLFVYHRGGTVVHACKDARGRWLKWKRLVGSSTDSVRGTHRPAGEGYPNAKCLRRSILSLRLQCKIKWPYGEVSDRLWDRPPHTPRQAGRRRQVERHNGASRTTKPHRPVGIDTTHARV